MTVAEPIGTLQEQMVCSTSIIERDGFVSDQLQPCATNGSAAAETLNVCPFSFCARPQWTIIDAHEAESEVKPSPRYLEPAGKTSPNRKSSFGNPSSPPGVAGAPSRSAMPFGGPSAWPTSWPLPSTCRRRSISIAVYSACACRIGRVKASASCMASTAAITTWWRLRNLPHPSCIMAAGK
jgi:hypothetical protein